MEQKRSDITLLVESLNDLQKEDKIDKKKLAVRLKNLRIDELKWWEVRFLQGVEGCDNLMNHSVNTRLVYCINERHNYEPIQLIHCRSNPATVRCLPNIKAWQKNGRGWEAHYAVYRSGCISDKCVNLCSFRLTPNCKSHGFAIN